MLEEQIERDLKVAMLAGKSNKVTTLRGLKSTLLYAKVDGGKRDSGLTDDEVIALLSKEAKKRQESATLYQQGGAKDRADSELSEKALIEAYLPAKMSEAELKELVEAVITETSAKGPESMGEIIGKVKQRAGANSDGAAIAKLVKEKLL